MAGGWHPSCSWQISLSVACCWVFHFLVSLLFLLCFTSVRDRLFGGDLGAHVYRTNLSGDPAPQSYVNEGGGERIACSMLAASCQREVA